MSTPAPPPPPGGWTPQGSPQVTPGQPAAGAYYPDQAYYAPGWRSPVPTGPPAPRPPRRALRVVAVVVIVALVVALVAGTAFGVRMLLDRRPLGEVDGPVSAHVGQLRPGHCLRALPADGFVGRVWVVPCATEHEAEVVGLLPLPGDRWPGQDEVGRRVQAWCEMDTAQREAGFRSVVWSPSERSWGQGDRTGVCLAVAPQGGAVGSVTDPDAAG